MPGDASDTREVLPSNRHCVRFNQIIASILFRYIRFNDRDATESSTAQIGSIGLEPIEPNSDSKFKSISDPGSPSPMAPENASDRFRECESTTALLSHYEALQEELASAFKKARQIQEHVTANARTMGQYLGHLEGCSQNKFKLALKQQRGEMKGIEHELAALMAKQAELTSRRTVVASTLNSIIEVESREKTTMRALADRHRECVSNVQRSKVALTQSLEEHSQTLQDEHARSLKRFERHYKSWDKDETVSWLLIIDNHRFSSG